MHDTSRCITLLVLGFLAVCLAAGMVVCAVEQVEIPPSFSGLLGGAVGAFSGLLTQREGTGSVAVKDEPPDPERNGHG